MLGKSPLGFRQLMVSNLFVFLIEIAKEHIEGNITIDEAQQRIEDYYKERVERTQTE